MAINYFYHPLGDYASNLIPGEASWSEIPHTRTSHGLSKMDIGCGQGHIVYSMTNGTVSSIVSRTDSDQKGYVVVIKTTETGYSSMVANELGGNASDYPLYFSYLELEYLKDPFAEQLGVDETTACEAVYNCYNPGITVTKGQALGVTNGYYTGSNVHIDIGGNDRYQGIGNNITQNNSSFLGNIRMGQSDYYLDGDIDIKNYLTSGFSISNDNIIDSEGYTLGIAKNDKYYPPDSSGNAVTEISSLESDNLVSKYYEYCILCQKPQYLSPNSISNNQNNYDEQVDVGEQDDNDMKAAIGVIIYEVGGESAFGNKPNYYAFMELVSRCLRNRVLAGTYGGNSKNVWNIARCWKGEGVAYYDKTKMINVYTAASVTLQNFIYSVLQGNNYFYVEDVITYADTNYGDANHLYYVTGFNVGQDTSNLIGTFEGTNGRVNCLYYTKLIEDGIVEV